MKAEIEVKFLNIDHQAMRSKLKSIGAVCRQPMRLMRRVIMDYPDQRLQRGSSNSYIRVRDEGDKVTLTYKKFESLELSGAKEIELEVSSFSDTIKLLQAIGLEETSFQESKRETWDQDECEIVLDEWPWLHPYLEIEGPREEDLHVLAQKLDLNWEEAVFGDVMMAYRAQYPDLKPEQKVGNLKQVRFDLPPPDFMAN